MQHNTEIGKKAYQAALRMQGFTLIELLIVVAILGILASIAYPSYGQYVQNSRRTDGRLALLQEIQTLERCKSTRYSYANCTLTNNESPESYYALTMQSTATAFTITATAQGAQAHDSECNVMSITNQGIQTPDPDTTGCWPN